MRLRVWLAASVALLAPAAPAEAAFPGQNGKIAFTSSIDGDSEIYSINPDGTDANQLTSNAVGDFSPSWSPDGRQIVFLRQDGADYDIWKMDADGTGQVLVHDYPGAPGFAPNAPAWSPDAAKIVFGVTDSDNRGLCTADFEDDVCGLFTINPDGSGLQLFVGTLSDACCPSWSPDGTRVAFSDGEPGLEGVYRVVVKPITGPGTIIAAGPGLEDVNIDPDWSPGQDKIDYTYQPETGGGAANVRTMNPDGSGKVQGHEGRAPAFSPDGTKVAFFSNGPPAGIWTGGAPLGTGATHLISGSSPSWQPIPVNAYPRPKGATPSRFSLVPAFLPCASPNRTHGPPLAFPSCTPPIKNSPHVTVPTPEANGHQVAFQGSLRSAVVVGNPATPADEADVTLTASGSDVRCDDSDPPATCGAPNALIGGGPGLLDYTGELEAVLFLRITDKDNTPHPGGPGAATVADFDMRFGVPCTGTASTSAGSICSITTSADTLMPGAVKEGRRAVWELDRVHVRDGGPDGDADTTGNRVFLRPGVHVP